MTDLEHWTLPELLLDLQEANNLIPVAVMETILERGESALDPLLELVEEINCDPDSGTYANVAPPTRMTPPGPT